MRWFKHFTDAQRDESLQQVRDVHGWEGYGIYWGLLELIAEKVDAGDEAKLTISTKQLARNLGIYRPKLEKILNTLRIKSLIHSDFEKQESEFYVTLTCSKLLEIKDEWTRKKEKAPESKNKNSGGQEVEVEVDPDPEKDPPLAPPQTQSAQADEKPKRKAKRQLPDDFELTYERKRKANEYWHKRSRPDLDPGDEFEKFVAHHRARGTTMLDWDAAWKTWYTNALKFNKPQLQAVSGGENRWRGYI